MRNRIKTLFIAAFLLGGALQTHAHGWTYFAAVSGAKFYLWLPPQVTQINGLILASEARLTQIAGDTAIRKACAEAGLGIVGFKGARFNSGFFASDNRVLQAGLAALAGQSHFAEVEFAPWISYGTSVGGIFAWQVARVNPARMLGVIEDNALTTDSSYVPGAYGIPLLISRGSAEPVGDRWFLSRDSILALRRHGSPSTMLVKAGCGHFSWTAWEAQYMALWLKKLVQYRIPTGQVATAGPLNLNPLVEANGWLSDTTFTASTLDIGPFHSFADTANAFWHMDQELATLWQQMHLGQFQRASQTIVTPPYPATSCGQAFQTCRNLTLGNDLPGNLLDLQATSTAGLPVRIGGYNGGFVLSPNADTIHISSLAIATTGQTGWVYAINEGDATHQCGERPIRFQVQPKTSGTAQTTTATRLADTVMTTPPITFTASISSGLPAEVLIESGAIHREGGRFVIEPFPRGVSTAIVYYGQSGTAQLATANNVVDTFLIRRADSVTYVLARQLPTWGAYPNPVQATQALLLRLPAGADMQDATLLDAAGRTVRTWPAAAVRERALPLRGISPGIYTLHLQGAKTAYRSKVVVE